MAKIRRNAARPAPARPAKFSGPSKKAQARPAVKKAAKAAAKAKPAAARPAAKSATAAKPAQDRRRRRPRHAAKAAKPSPAKPVGKPVRASAPPPQRSTYADAVSLYERGMQALQAKRYREAAETLKAVIARFPEEKELHERAQLYIRVCERQLTPLDATPKTPEEQVYAATLAINSGAGGPGHRAAHGGAAAGPRQRPRRVHARRRVLAQGRPGRRRCTHISRALELNPDNRELVRKEPDLEALRQTDGDPRHPRRAARAAEEGQAAGAAAAMIARRASRRCRPPASRFSTPRRRSSTRAWRLARGTTIHPGRHARGPHAHRRELPDPLLGPHHRLGARRTTSFINDSCVIVDSVVDDGGRVGPFAHLRPGSHMKAGCHVGNFVELKKTTLGEGSKANHLAYLGDATIGAGVNVGAGTITCNYDGVHKHPTTIEDGAFIGSDSQLVAPGDDWGRGVRGRRIQHHRGRACRGAGHRPGQAAEHQRLGGTEAARKSR